MLYQTLSKVDQPTGHEDFRKWLVEMEAFPRRVALAETLKDTIVVTSAENQDKVGKRNLVPDRKFKRRDVTDNIVKQALVVWGDSSSESEGDNEKEDTSMMAIESKAAKYDSIFALMAKFDDDKEDDDDEGTVKGSSQQWYMDSDCSKLMTESTNDFLSLKALQGGSVSFENGKKGYILGVGRIGKSLSHSIKNAYYVKGLKYSLLGISQICDKGILAV
uniref:Uncharacterized protein LOC104226030 n=1 Tax=Nicotiana sylvestris TaxID=4096 RepID=A0A1U7WPN9_NICSY|nr:PREDICTED: uncharacterized protein LOC104226030 [Nicotiana sylvestris]